MEGELCNRSAGTFFQIVNVGNDIELNILMYQSNDICS